MTVMEVGNKLVEYCKKGENLKAIETLYSQNIVSVEAVSMPDMPAEMRGMEAIVGKNKWWLDNHEIHSAICEGPFPQPLCGLVHGAGPERLSGSAQMAVRSSSECGCGSRWASRPSRVRRGRGEGSG